MRSGRLLAEDSPANLLKLHQCISLEDVFLKLCMKDKMTNNASHDHANALPNNQALPALPMPGSPAVDQHNPNLSIVAVCNEKNRHHHHHHHSSEAVVVPEENGIIGLAFHQSKEQLVGSDDKV